MARTYAAVQSAIWNDPDFVALDINAQRLYLLLVSQPEISMCGVLTVAVTRWAGTAADSDEADVLAGLKTLEDARFVVVDRDAEELWVRSFVRHNVAGVKAATAAKAALGMVHSRRLRTAIAAEDPTIFDKRNTPSQP